MQNKNKKIVILSSIQLTSTSDVLINTYNRNNELNFHSFISVRS